MISNLLIEFLLLIRVTLMDTECMHTYDAGYATWVNNKLIKLIRLMAETQSIFKLNR